MTYEDTVTIAKENVPFYRDLGPCEEMPYIDKVTVANNIDNFISKKYNGILRKQLVSFQTSGTTGRPSLVYWNENDLIKANLHLWKYRKKEVSISPTDKYCSFHMAYTLGSKVETPQKVKISKDGKNLSLCSLFSAEKDILFYYNVILSYEPAWMFVAPSIIIKFIDVMKKHNLPKIKSIKYIELVGEAVNNDEINNIASFLSVTVRNMYGMRETGAIAYQCSCGKMHFIDENVHINEIIVDGQNNYGELVLTSLVNTAMPLINYRTGDLVELADAPCQCGKNGLAINRIYGRKTYGVFYKGKWISDGVLSYCISVVNSHLCNIIKQYKLVKRNDGSLYLMLLVDNEFHNWKNILYKELLEAFSNISIDVTALQLYFVHDSDVFLSQNGKYKTIIEEKYEYE